MSNKKQDVLETLLGQIDVYLVWDENGPQAAVPASDRAKALFIRWGMPENADGIEPPHDALDLVESMPNDWTIGMGEPVKEDYLIAEVPLPQPRLVLH